MHIMKWSLIIIVGTMSIACSDGDAPNGTMDGTAPNAETQSAPAADASLTDQQKVLLGESPNSASAPVNPTSTPPPAAPIMPAEPVSSNGSITATPNGAKGNKDIGSRPLTDADIDKYAAITTELAKLGQPADHEEINKILTQQGMTYGEYSVLSTRVNIASTMLGMNQSVPVPDIIKGDLEVVRRNLEKINTAKNAQSNTL